MPYLGEICALTTALLWALSAFIFTSALSKINYIRLNIIRLIFALVYLIITMLIAGINFNIHTDQLIFLTLSGFFGLVIGDSFLFKAFEMNGPRISLLLMTLSPVFTTIITFFILKENISWLGIAGISITIFGIILVLIERKNSTENNVHISRRGIFYATLGALGQGIGLIFAKLAFNHGEINGITATFYRIAAALIIFIPFIIKSRLVSGTIDYFKSDRKSLYQIAFGSVLGPYLGITLSIMAVSLTNTGVSATLMSTVPIMMLPLSRIIYKEKLNWKSVLGAFVAVAGVTLIFLK